MDSTEVTHYRAYRIRWIQLIVFVLATFSNAITSITFAPIESETSKFYKITSAEINSLAIVFLFLYPFGTILSIWLSRKLSMRSTIIIGSILNLGVFIRLLSLSNRLNPYISLIIGQIFPAIAAPFFLNSTALFASRWFSPSQRDIATSICSMANPLGLAIGSLVPSLIITANPSAREFFILLISESLLVLLATFLIIIIFRSEPPTPPSSSEEHHQAINFKEDFINLMKNRQYLILLFGFSIGLALFNAITTLLEQLIEPQGYSSENAGIFGAIIIIAGLFNAFLAGFIMDKTHSYRLILKILLIGACGSAIFFILILQPNKFYPLAASIGLMGFFLLPLLPVSFECALESTYPIRPEWSTGLLMCFGNIIGGVFIFFIGYLIKLDSQYKHQHIFRPSTIFILCSFIISSLTLFIYKGSYLRLEAEKQTIQKSSINNSSNII
ncbi:unnamed protein product [Rotaria magnacalcarata]|uniref:Major facilitator superfamily (MFS) profile domain-containing protein n=1 Tax=Rotaria magnacalcarata TaxID=392030 RepID=A0A816KP63_9BILA|nr:unnamed protein product [Rotaria magnacalcarata]CAF1920830.1 unnamed protein product [Rotaria magnacalcarata]CAF1935827.1 unnamed protein product [Rotaria magnacalcarata]CAF3826016.1 unnamed protein product [Rotaria magnacalcarata]CAF4200793.1 unnamed protein product [Rotaria magnacalcarata]